MAQPSSPDLNVYENCLCFNLQRSARMIAQFYDVAVKQFGLTVQQFSLLATLSNFKDGVELTTLAEYMGVERTTLTRNLKHMQNKGLVETVSVPDGRVRQLKLTKEGEAILKKASPEWRKAQTGFSKALSNENTADLLRLLNKVSQLKLPPQNHTSTKTN